MTLPNDDDAPLFEDDAPLFGDDAPLFGDDAPTDLQRPDSSRGAAWILLVVDDEPSIHQVTRLALGGFSADGHPVTLLHAHSAEEGRALLEAHPECALVLLDVVMESDDAGLRFVEWTRTTLGNPNVRIILRTGQPGLAPEEAVMARYDIHDYHAKTELSARRLRTAVTGGLRSYRDLRTLTLQRHGLEKVIAATGSLFAPRNLSQLLSGILEQVTALLVPREHAIFFLSRGPLFADLPTLPEPIVLAASGRFAEKSGLPLAQVLDGERCDEVEHAARPGTWTFLGDDGLFGFDIGEPTLPALFLEGARHLSDWERQTIALFCASAAMALRNQRLYLEREDLLAAFARFVPNEFIALVGKTDVRTLSVGDQQVRDLSVCFVDVEGFTERSETMGPARVFALLNRIYSAIGPVAVRHGGVIDKYMGDGVMILFPGGPADAVAAAVGIQRALRELNRDDDLRERPIVVRASIEHGSVILGTVGHAGRFDTTVISDVANVAARLQGWCRTLDVNILVSDRCRRGLKGHPARELGSFDVRGRREPVVAWEVYEADADATRAAKDRIAAVFDGAVAHRRHGRWLDAIGELRLVLESCPSDGAAKWMLADCAKRADARGGVAVGREA
jgi:class 3 adenylate cyclase/CheY-like chemotaxis protein